MDWQYILTQFFNPAFYQAALVVLQLSVSSWVISGVLGMLVALGRQSRLAPLRWVLGVYVWFFRSLPLLVLLILVYNVPQAFPAAREIIANPFMAGLIALVLSETAYMAEIHRGGLSSVARGQGEAARALGIPWRGVQLHIVIPQAFRVSLPSLANELVSIVKLTSLVSAISLTELLLVGQRLYTQNFLVLETLFVVAIFYVALVSVLTLGTKALERHLDVSRRQRTDTQLEAAAPHLSMSNLQRTPREKGDVLLSVRSVTKSYGEHAVLNDINLDVHKSEVVAIIGPSGSGKTTLIRTLNALETIDGGDVSMHGAPVGYQKRNGQITAIADKAVARQRRQLGMVFQQFHLFPHKTALENVTFALTYLRLTSKRDAEQQGRELLRKVGLAAHAEKYPHQLSGGQQQRVAIARALAVSPEVILFDEPTSALDPELVDEVLAVMAELAADGLTMVIVTHEMRFAQQVADTIVFMEAGSIVETGTASQMFATPTEERTRQFLKRVELI